MSNFENKIKATDIRLGNYFNVPNREQSPFRVDEIEYLSQQRAKVGMSLIPCGHPLTWYLDDLSGVPLTEDWLLKLGFSSEEYRDKSKHIGINFGQTDFTLVKPGSLDFEHIKHFGFEFDAGGWPRLKQFEYVHELQNFFYCYSGEELEVKI